MKSTEFIESIGYATITVSISTPVWRTRLYFDVDHVADDDDMFYVEDASGQVLEINKAAEILFKDGVYSVEQDGCKICIKLDE